MNEQDTKTVNELLEKLSKARSNLEAATKIKADILTTARGMREYTSAESIVNIENAIIAEVEEKIRTLVLTEWVNNQNKHPHEKVEVKIFKTFKVVDPAAMRKWVFEKLADALQVDQAKVKKYAMEIGPVEGCETGEEARVQIASKL